MAYKTMKSLITNYKGGRRTYTKEELADMCDVFFAVKRLSTTQYTELIAEIEALE